MGNLQNAMLICSHYEGFRAKPYICPAGKPTIGYGTTIYPNGLKVTMKDPGVSRQVAQQLMTYDLQKFEADVISLVKVPLNESQINALVSFAYNVGPDIDADNIAEGLGDSTLLKLINSGIITKDPMWKKKITAEFGKWVNMRKAGKVVKAPGLIARRNTEAYLFTEGILKFFN